LNYCTLKPSGITTSSIIHDTDQLANTKDGENKKHYHMIL
jgi:hypothetical protein